MKNKFARLLIAIAAVTSLVTIFSGCGGSNNTSKLIIFSDVHFNPFYDPTLFDSLVAADANEWKTIFETSDVTAPSTWENDSNYPLFKLALAGITTHTAGSSAAIFPGDILVHHFATRFYDLYGSEDEAAMRAFLLKTVTFFAEEVRANFGDIPVVFALGNNDSYEGDYKIEPNSPFLADTAAPFYANFLNGAADQDEFNATYEAGGYYSATPFGSDLLVITLNSIFFSSKADSGTEAAAYEELDWLETQLAAASAAGQQVCIVTHIPTGVSISSTKDMIDPSGHLTDADMMWVEDFQTRFLNLLSTYDNSIKMIFTGHTHMDEFRLPLQALELTPSISPIDGNDPAFKVFVYQTDTFEPKNFNSFNYSLANLQATFSNYYNFSSAYGASGLLSDMLEETAPLLATDETKQATYRGYYYSGNNAGSPITDLNWPVYWCGIHEMVKTEFIDCVNNYGN